MQANEIHIQYARLENSLHPQQKALASTGHSAALTALCFCFCFCLALVEVGVAAGDFYGVLLMLLAAVFVSPRVLPLAS